MHIFYLCAACGDNCSTCNDDGSCQICASGFKIDNGNTANCIGKDTLCCVSQSMKHKRSGHRVYYSNNFRNILKDAM